MNPEKLPSWLRPGTRIASVLVGIAFGLWYVFDLPNEKDKNWPGTAATIIAALLVALVIAEPFKVADMRRGDAWPAAFALLMAVVSLLLAIRNAAYHAAFSRPIGAIVLGSMCALGWLVLTGVLDALIRRAAEGDGTPPDKRDASG